MKSILLAIINASFLLFCSIAASESLLIKNITLLSPDRDASFGNAYVLVENDRIKAISSTPINVGVKTIVINGAGRYLIPGLIDSHVHLSSLPGLNNQQAENHPELISAFQQQQPKSFLYFGFTTLIDLKQTEQFAAKWRQHALASDLVHCQSLPYMNGYGMRHLPEEERLRNPYFLYDERQSDARPDYVNPSKHSAEALVEKVTTTPAKCIKTAYESGFSGLWNFPTPTNEQMSELHLAAKKQGLTHVHHGNSLSAYRQAAAAKVDVIAHGLWHWEEENGNTELPSSIKNILDEMIANGTQFQLTSQVLESELRLLDGRFFELADLKHSLPPALIKWHFAHKEHWYMEELKGLIAMKPDLLDSFYGKPSHSDDISDISHEALRRLKLIAQYLVGHKATLLLGSDTPSSPTYANPPGLTSYLEMESLARLGVPLRTLFSAATINNATAFGIDAEVGSIEVGKKANLLILRSNPLQAVEAYREIDAIILAGKLHDRDSFSASSK